MLNRDIDTMPGWDLQAEECQEHVGGQQRGEAALQSPLSLYWCSCLTQGNQLYFQFSVRD